MPNHEPDPASASRGQDAGPPASVINAVRRSMRIRVLSLWMLFSVGFMVPSRAVALDPLANEVRAVHPMVDENKSVTVIDGMVWYDGDPASHGIRFPPGIYLLEAEDADYFYFRSPKPLEFRTFKGSNAVDGHEIPGGLMLSKHTITMIPGAGYIDDKGSNKRMLWKLGVNFLQLKGRFWTKSF